MPTTIVRRYAGFFAAVFMTNPPVAGAIVTFNLVPENGQVSGAPGSIVGWGYSIANSSATDWLVTSGLNADAFLFGNPNAIFDFPIIAPGETVSLPFDAFSGTGLYEFTWDLNAPKGFTNFGTFSVSAEWWSGDPFSGGAFLQLAPDLVQRYSAAVSENVVPEPATGVLFLGAGVLLGAVWRWRMRQSTPTGRRM